MDRAFRLAALVLVVGARVAPAHDLPIPNSTCSFAPLEVAFPALGLTGTAAAPVAADALRIVYTARQHSAQFDAQGVPPRALSGLGTSASLILPEIFPMRLLGSGDLSADVPLLLVLTVDGTPSRIPVALTTGLTAAGGLVLEGAPMDASGMFTLVGAAVADDLAAPLGGATAVFRLSCAATPVPDLDQFPVVETKRLGGRITTRRLRLHGLLAPGTLVPDFPGMPALVWVSVDGAPLVTVDLPGGLAARGRRAFVGQSADGQQSVALHLRRRRPTPTWALAVRVGGPLPALPVGRPVVTLTAQVGGLLSRAARPFRGAR